jgi:hypothetical protein
MLSVISLRICMMNVFLLCVNMLTVSTLSILTISALSVILLSVNMVSVAMQNDVMLLLITPKKGALSFVPALKILSFSIGKHSSLKLLNTIKID